MKYAVLVATAKCFRFVTFVDYKTNFAHWEADKEAVLMTSSLAKDLARDLCINGYCAMVVEVPKYICDMGNYKEV